MRIIFGVSLKNSIQRESYSAPSLKVTLLLVDEVLLATAEHVSHLGEELV